MLGWSEFDNRPVQRAFPAWLTIPSAQDLATGRVWHFFFAWLFVGNGLLYLSSSIFSGRLSRDLLPDRQHWRQFGRTVRDHLRFRLQRDTGVYNVLQRLTYLLVVLALAPLVILTGLTMSPAIAAAAPWLLDLFGGRQSARSIHFILTGLFVLFGLVHVVIVLVSGFLTNMRAMITGWYAIAGETARHEHE